MDIKSMKNTLIQNCKKENSKEKKQMLGQIALNHPLVTFEISNKT